MQTSKLSKIIFTLPALPLLFLLLLSLLPIENSSAERVSVTLEDLDSYIDISATDVDLLVGATPTGHFNSTTENIVVHTSSGSGYKLYLAMADNATDSKLYLGGDSAKESLSATSAVSGEPDLNSWGFSLDNDAWRPVPLKGSEANIKTSAHQAFPSSGSGDTTTIYFGAKADTSLPGGTYTGEIRYTAVADVTSATTGQATAKVTNVTDDGHHASITGGDSVVITTSLYTTVPDLGDITLSINGSSCQNPLTTSTETGTLVVSCDNLPAQTSGGLKTAVLSIPKFDKTYSTVISYGDLWSVTEMQDMTPTVCENTATPKAKDSDGNVISTITTSRITYSATASSVPQSTMSDTRDMTSYTVRKLADGNCWMVQNLDLDLHTSKTLTDEDTDLVSKTSWTPTNDTAITTGVWNASDHSYDPGNQYWDPSSISVVTAQGSLPSYRHIGNFYNHLAASAGSLNTSSSSYVSMTDTICPKGWTIPFGSNSYDSKKSFQNLNYTTYGLTVTEKIFNGPMAFSGGGIYWNDGSGLIAQKNTYAITKRSQEATLLSYHDNNIMYGTGSGNTYSSGYVIRCVAR